jgi:hypothetical protein
VLTTNNPRYADPEYWRNEWWGVPSKFQECLRFASDHGLICPLRSVSSSRKARCLHAALIARASEVLNSEYKDLSSSLAQAVDDREEYEAIRDEAKKRIGMVDISGPARRVYSELNWFHATNLRDLADLARGVGAALHLAHLLRERRVQQADSPEVVVRIVGEDRFNQLRDQQVEVIAPLLWDIVGNPFDAVAFDPAWRTSNALRLAKHICDTCDFAAMPILADALQDAGCEHATILDHCRDPNDTHAHGCWVVDLVLGKS